MKFCKYSLLTFIIIAGVFLSSCSQSVSHSQVYSDQQMQEMAANMDEQLTVDCVPPPQVRSRGGSVYLRKGRPSRSTVLDCRNKGGEFTVNASRKKRLEIWQAKANEGDVEAQIYVGEIYEKGLDTPPDYEFAAIWYKKAAEQGSKRAQNNLAFLYEKGWGVAKDPLQAFKWYKKAAGEPNLTSIIRLTPDEARELIRLRQEISQKSTEAEKLRQQLDKVEAQLGKISDKDSSLEQSLVQQERQQALNQQYTERLLILTEKIKTLENDLNENNQALDRQSESKELTSLRREINHKSTEAEQLRKQLEKAQVQLRKVNEKDLALEKNQVQREHLQALNIQYTDRLSLLTKKIKTLEVDLKSSSQIQAKHTELVEEIARKTQETEELKESLRDSQSQLAKNQTDMKVMRKGHDIKNHEKSNEIKTLNQTIAQLKLQLESTNHILEDGKKKLSKQFWNGVNFGRYHALIIGNNQYKHLSKLRTPVNDAKRLDTVLKQKYGFQTKLLLNANRVHIIDALGDYRESLRPEDSLLIFYAGHGTVTAARGFWQGVDSKPDRESDWISNIDITEILEQMQARHILVVVDSCYSGAISRGSMKELNPNMQETEQLSWIKQKLSLISRTAITSGGLSPVPDGSGKHSVFAHAFMSHLEINKSVLAARSIFNTIEPRVISRAQNAGAKQTPEYARLVAAADENGEFYFKPMSMSAGAEHYQFASLLWETQYFGLSQ